MRDISVGFAEDGSGLVRARASVSYPDDWSTKSGRSQRAHLSTIDVLLLAGEMCESYLAHCWDLDAGERARVRIRRADIRAGRAPVENDLGGFPVQASILTETLTDVSPDESAKCLSVANCQVGPLRIRCEIEHIAGRRRVAAGWYRDVDDLLGPVPQRPFAGRYKKITQHIGDLVLDFDDLRGQATVRPRLDGTSGALEPPPAGEPRPEPGTERELAPSMVDCFVVALQLGQILLYTLDGVDRADSNTMWMRHTVLEADEPATAPAIDAPVISVRLENLKLLTSAGGRDWRSADVAARLANIRIRCSVAHMLP